jgi:uncharacterized repeat protein (TIGR03847 family)
VNGLNRREFDGAERVEAEAIGQPGQRRFRLVVASGGETVFLWMEKQQLQALGLAFEQILAQLQTVQIVIPMAEQPDLSTRPEGPSLGLAEYVVGRLAVGFDETRQRMTIIVHEPAAEEDAQPDFICRITNDQSGALAYQIRRVVTVGARQHSNGHLSGLTPSE